MRRLMDDALLFAQPDGQGRDADAVTEVNSEVQALVEVRRAEGQDIRLALPDQPLFAAVSPMALRRMLMNLLDNAARYGGPRVTISISEVADEVVIIVEYNGAGVPEAALTAMAQPFVRLEESRARHTGGAGLGLSIVQALAHRFGGRFDIGNRDGGGLRAVLYLGAGIS